MIFANKTRTLEGGLLPGMGPFSYLDQSNRPEAEAIRRYLEAMLSRYPADAQASLAARLRSDDEDVHVAAFFELILHELVVRRRFQVVSVEAEAPGVRTRPDFLLQDAKGLELYLEATLATGTSAVAKKRQQEEDKVLGALYRVKHPKFLLGIRDIRLASQTVSERSIQGAVMARLDQLAANPASAGSSSLSFELEIKGVRLELKAVERKTPDSPNLPGVAFVSMGLRAVRSSAAIRKKVLDKAARYGNALNRPFFIAINSTQILQRDEDFEQALFGTEQYTWYSEMDEVQASRAADGAFIQGERVRYSRVSGILCFYNLTPWTLGTAKARVLENPFAEAHYDLSSLGLPTARAQGNELVTLAGTSLAELLGLTPDWPTQAALSEAVL